MTPTMSIRIPATRYGFKYFLSFFMGLPLGIFQNTGWYCYEWGFVSNCSVVGGNCPILRWMRLSQKGEAASFQDQKYVIQ
jgi:hypothetical protein